MIKKNILTLILGVSFVLTGCSSQNSQISETSQPMQTTEIENTSAITTEISEEESTAIQTEEEKNEENQIHFTDMMDREVQLSAPAEKIVILSPADCEILYAIGAENTLIGRGELCNYPEEILSITSITSGSETNIEQIIALQPDVLIISSMEQTEEQVDQLEAAGVSVAVSTSEDINGLYKVIEMLGMITGNNIEAKALIEDMKFGFENIAERVEQIEEKKTVYFEISPLEYGLWSVGDGTFLHDFAIIAGLENIFSDITGWSEVSQEQVIERNPDYIITTSFYMGEGALPDEEIVTRAGWENISAVKNNAVFAVDTDIFSRAGPRLLDAAELLYEYIYEDVGSN